MAVLESNQTKSNNRNGFDKEISKSARTMMLDNVQNFMYQKPIPSCARETVSNCIDATNEKLVALKIINGEIDVKSVYKTLDDVEVAKDEDNIYQDSEFKREYYDPKWLSSNNRIDIRYVCNPVAGERDTFSITDNGVGIGDSRLEGVFAIGYSSKRLNTNEIGGFGLGAKSALATGVASYRMTTRHNGRKFTFDIFSHKIENVISKWNEDGTTNPHMEFANTLVDSGETREVVGPEGDVITEKIYKPFEAYYTPTTEKNGTTIEFEVKNHNKQAFIDAVKSQMMYLKDDIVFTLTDSYGNNQDIPFKSTPIYEDENIILSNYGYYNRPHFVIKGFAYGIIDFAEAELSPKFGNMGFKFNMEDLDVLPSREGVRYTPKTTAAILDIYEKNKATVTRMLQEELNETKFFPWLKSANKISNRAGNGNSQDVISRLSSLSDQSDLDLKFNDSIKYSSSFKTLATPLLGLQFITGKKNREESDYTSILNDSTHFQFEPSSSRKTAYLLVSNPSITIIRSSVAYRYLAPVFSEFIKGNLTKVEAISEAALVIEVNEVEDTKRKNIKEFVPKALEFLHLMNVDGLVPSYDTLEVPEDFKVREDTNEEDIQTAIEADRYKQIIAERRANREFYIQTFELRSAWNHSSKLERKLVKFSELDKKVNDGVELVYFTEDSDEQLKSFVANTRMNGSSNKPYDNDKLMLFKIAKSNVNQVKLIAKTIDEWFYNIDDEGVLKLAPGVNALINHTLKFNSPSWARESAYINEGLHEKITKLENLAKNPLNSDSIKVLDDITRINKLAIELDNDYENELLDKAISEFNQKYKLPKDVTKIKCIDKRILKLTEECEDFKQVYDRFLSHVNIKKIKEEIEIILQSKKDQLKFKFKGLHDDINS